MNKKITSFVASLAILVSTAATAAPASAIAAAPLPESFDISTNLETYNFFPKIFNQGRQGSCTACATTYYQFTYEVRRAMFKNDNYADLNFFYSPAYMYNLINFGQNNGSCILNAYASLKNHGALNLDQFGYDSYYDQISKNDKPAIRYINNWEFNNLRNDEKNFYEPICGQYRRKGVYIVPNEYNALSDTERERYIPVYRNINDASPLRYYYVVNSYRINPQKTNPKDIISALKWRLKGESDLNCYDQNSIEDIKLEINEIKKRICEKKVVVTSGVFSYDNDDCEDINMKSAVNYDVNNKVTNNKRDNVFFYNFSPNPYTDKEAFSSVGSHAFTIVGYDDNIACDINNDGYIQDSEKGAFKIANSWGTYWGNEGFAWIMYDALYPTSQAGCVIPNVTRPYTDSEGKKKEYTIERCHAFSHRGYYTIDVEEKPVTLVSEVELITNNTYAIVNDNINSPTYAICNRDYNEDKGRYELINDPAVFSGSLFNDITEDCNDIIVNDKHLKYGNHNVYNIKLKNIDQYDSHFSVKAVRIKDSLGNTVAEKIMDENDFYSEYDNGNRRTYFEESLAVDFPKGDMNYDHKLDRNDSEKINEYFNILYNRYSDNNQKKTINDKFSSFQIELLDANDDGVVDINDYQELNNMINS